MKKKIKLINKTKNIKISLITCDDDYSVNEMGYMLEFENVTTHTPTARAGQTQAQSGGTSAVR